MTNEPTNILTNLEVRTALIDYYKWVVSVAIFVFTVSLSFVGIHGKELGFSWFFRLGWLLLGVCIFANMLLIKRLVTLPIVLDVPESEKGFRHWLFMATIKNIKLYGTVQNLAFLLGVLGISLGFVLNWVF